MRALLEDNSLTGQWVLDPSASSIRLKSWSFWGLVSIKGAFTTLSGSGSVSPDGDVSGTITVASASVDTRNTKRDGHLRSPDFFDSDNYPDITFTATDVRPTEQAAKVSGRLTIRDRTRPLSFNAVASFPGDGEVRLDAEVPINRAEFGLTWNLMGTLSTKNVLTVRAVFMRR
jgi:polyisoprenoid-binding protein YceI